MNNKTEPIFPECPYCRSIMRCDNCGKVPPANHKAKSELLEASRKVLAVLDEHADILRAAISAEQQ